MNEIDLKLAVVDACTPAGVTWSRAALARFVGCSEAYLFGVEQRALARLRRDAGMRRWKGYIGGAA